MKIILRSIPVLYLLTFIHHKSYSQLFPEKNYPKKYFQWPVAAPPGIAANFGELRPNHYHMGLDARTEQRQNIPVLAAAEGYIAKVKIEPSGFGRCIYINHPNGLTTLYAHLNDFYPALEKYVTAQQYKLRQWNVFIDIPVNLFPVKKGEVIAKSGNTGGSQGPHLHFEIRDTKTDKVLNPLLFGFPITDNIPPVVVRLAVYDRCISTYDQTPRLLSLKKVNGIYQPAGDIIVNTDRVSFAVTAFDRYTGSTNQNGIYKATVFDNDVPVSGFEMDSISYDETRYLNAHIDYKIRSKGGPYLQHLSSLPGYKNGIYKSKTDNGVIQLEGDALHSIKIIITDAAGNDATIAFKIKAGEDLNPRVLEPDLQMFHPGFINVFENDHVRFYLQENSLYDSFRFRYAEIPAAAGGMIYQLHDPSVPVQNRFTISIKGNFLPADTSKIIMKRSYGTKQDYLKAVEKEGWFTSRFREFGNYQLLIDNSPPVISPISITKARIAFSITDDTEELQNFTALLDGNWLRFSNDKGRTFIYNFDEHCQPGPHELKVMVEDQVGNKSERTIRFSR